MAKQSHDAKRKGKSSKQRKTPHITPVCETASAKTLKKTEKDVKKNKRKNKKKNQKKKTKHKAKADSLDAKAGKPIATKSPRVSKRKAINLPNKVEPQLVAPKRKKVRTSTKPQGKQSSADDRDKTDALLQSFFKQVTSQAPTDPESNSKQVIPTPSLPAQKNPTKAARKEGLAPVEGATVTTDIEVDAAAPEPAEKDDGKDGKNLELVAAASSAGTSKTRWKTRHLRQVYANQLPYSATQNTIRNFFREVVPKSASNFIKV